MPIRHSLRSFLCLGLTSAAALHGLCLPSLADEPPLPFLGEIRTFASPRCPTNFMQAAGQTLDIAGNSDLFSVIATTYGGDGRTNFALPNLQGQAVVGASTAMPIGKAVGASSVTLDATQVPLVSHSHDATFAPVSGTAPVTLPATPGTLAVTPKLLAKQATGVVGVKDGYLLSQGGIGQSTAPIYIDPANSAATAQLGGLTAEVTGLSATAATTFQVPVVTGGTVTVNPKSAAATAPVPIQSPALPMTVCIAVKGYLPTSN
ncbi:phage tail protein [Methylobacterium terrae]|uniref:phage tail protein n=1 Tax=Methylobacterium terrae TaxID=2202827 RepID=UPI0013A52F73|nr:tail fiber protein [Methylobacterium terrae]